MSAQLHTGRTNQKERTRNAIVTAAHDLVCAGAEVTMPVVAAKALVSEATAYRYFPDLSSLLTEVVGTLWPPPAEIFAPLADEDDPVERIGFATEALLSRVHTVQAAVRATMAAAMVRAEGAAARPGYRFGLIDEALAPFVATLTEAQTPSFEQLRRGLAVVVSADAFFVLTDLCGLTSDEAIASAVHTARTLTAASVAAMHGEPVTTRSAKSKR